MSNMDQGCSQEMHWGPSGSAAMTHVWSSSSSHRREVGVVWITQGSPSVACPSHNSACVICLGCPCTKYSNNWHGGLPYLGRNLHVGDAILFRLSPSNADQWKQLRNESRGGEDLTSRRRSTWSDSSGSGMTQLSKYVVRHSAGSAMTQPSMWLTEAVQTVTAPASRDALFRI
jgi:hypothetical protein